MAAFRSITLVCLLGGAGCDVVFGVDAPSDLDPDGGNGGCRGPSLSSSFDGTDPCRPWAYPNENTVLLAEGSGHLRIQTLVAQSGYGGCTAAIAIPFEDFGFFAEISSIADQPNGYTVFGFFVGNPTGELNVKLAAENGKIQLREVEPGTATHGELDYDPEQMRWWRLRPTSERTGIVGEVSSDGLAWAPVGTALGTVPAEVVIDLGAGAYNNSVNLSSTATFEGVNVCPDP